MVHHRWIHVLAVFSVGVATGWIVSPGPGDTPPTSSSEFTESNPPPNALASSPHSEQVSDTTDDALSGHTGTIRFDSPQDNASVPSEQRTGTAMSDGPDGNTITPATTPEQFVSILRNGTDQERVTALTHSLEQDVQVPPDILRDTVQSDPSPDVRLLAFRMYVDAMSTDSDDANSALTLGAFSDDPDVRAEAQMRLAEFEELQQASVAQDPLQ